MNTVFLLGAEIDIQQAYEQFEEWSEGHGDRFLCELDGVLHVIASHPASARLHLDDYRRALISHFPRGIFYVVEMDRIVIHAVLDLRQDPRTIMRRLRGFRSSTMPP